MSKTVIGIIAGVLLAAIAFAGGVLVGGRCSGPADPRCRALPGRERAASATSAVTSRRARAR